ncbi:GGDEF domain-containing protein [Sphingomonas glacialis]|uniref:diguanylate cyclase n=1 Tax=Sphingomonas glacialis TaxID=658225 RepID=A0A502FR03_9SPHN|nr:GGDEF domain-containing protein [Sphingomonas glacialis]TPG51712.1 GGDEF domain-containing protein [Sphingomonas glacialis]
MGLARSTRLVAAEDRAAQVFDCVRAFLTLHRLSAEPAHYAFAYDVVCNPAGVIAKSVATMTEGGIRLSARDIESLGGGTVTTATAGASPDGLVAQTQMQVEGFTDMVRSMRAETADFGRDLAASATALQGGASSADMIRLTAVMLDRVQSAEARLQAATSEADQLRAKLEEARGDARRDPLTGLPNRRAFEEAFAEHTVRGTRLCLAVCDVDRFKRVNDQFGHSVGDRVLKAIAEALSAACEGHFVARYGGEEFVILFANVDLAQAHTTLESARLTVDAKRYRLRETDMPLGAVTFSAGLTPAETGELLGAVFGRADKLLYAAKDSGRNQVRLP